MRERAEQWLKILCWTLVALLLLQTGRALVRNHPFGQIALPVPPSLAPSAQESAASGPAGGGLAPGKSPASGPTNSSAGTNLAAGLNLTNRLTVAATNVTAGNSMAGSNAIPLTATNAPVLTTNSLSTNRILSVTNGPSATNGLVALPGGAAPIHAPPTLRAGQGSRIPGMGGPGQPGPALPPLAQARIDKIVASELLGPVMHPQPMALLGIAGEVAFLRTDSGQSGLVKVGDTLGDLKLLRIGINRVLVEQNGQPRELTIFSGMGSDSLLTTSNTSSNEITNH